MAPIKNYRHFFAFVLVLYSFMGYCAPVSPARLPVAIGGVLDLRRQDFSAQVALSGQWNFYWHQLVKPGETPKTKPTPVNFPFRWDGYLLSGQKLPSFGYATYTLTVLLPKNAPALSIGMQEVYTSYNLFVNGQKVASNGVVDTSATGFVPFWQYETAVLQPHADTLHLILQIANFVHSKAGVTQQMMLGKKDDVDLSRTQAAAIDLMLTGCLFMGGLFFLGLYTLGNRDRAILLFSLYCIDYAYRLCGTDNYTLHSVFPHINWYLAVRAEYMSLFMGIGLFGLYTLNLYPEDANKRIVHVLNTFCFAFAAAALVLPPYWFTQLINPFLLVMLFCLVYTPYIYFKAYLNKRPGSVYALVSAFVLMVVFAISLLHYWAIIPPLDWVKFTGYILFFFLQSLTLSHRVSFKLNKARQQAEQGLRSKSEFLSTMSHEIRTPLNAVIGLSHLLLKEDPRRDQKEYLDVMLFSANNLLIIVNDILDYNKIEAGKINFESIEMDLGAIVGNVVKGLKIASADKDIDLRLEVDPALQGNIMGDPTRTAQVISNLVHNAIKFTQQGYVLVTVKVIVQTKNNIKIRVSVKDTGIGIPANKQKLIFERFTQADSSISRGFGGTGLGLAITKRLLELQKSALFLESEEGKGSTFYFEQKFQKSAYTGNQNSPGNMLEKNQKPLLDTPILLVEDNPMNVMVAKTYLQRWGATVDVATNGLEALETFNSMKHKLVLIDLQMPVMDGFEAARIMRERGVTIPIIAFTANVATDVLEDTRAIGIDDVVVKPFLPEDLQHKILYHLYVNDNSPQLARGTNSLSGE